MLEELNTTNEMQKSYAVLRWVMTHEPKATIGGCSIALSLPLEEVHEEVLHLSCAGFIKSDKLGNIKLLVAGDWADYTRSAGQTYSFVDGETGFDYILWVYKASDKVFRCEIYREKTRRRKFAARQCIQFYYAATAIEAMTSALSYLMEETDADFYVDTEQGPRWNIKYTRPTEFIVPTDVTKAICSVIAANREPVGEAA